MLLEHLDKKITTLIQENILYLYINIYLFEVPKSVILSEIPFCPKNETSFKQFIKKFHQFIHNTSDVRINWLTKKMRTSFQLKDKSLHPPCKIYEGIRSCRESYVGETIKNVETRWSEHNKSSPSKHFNGNIIHVFGWKVFCNTPKKKLARKILAYVISTMKPTLNDQRESNLLHLFRNGIT